jgi:hypothetical protein
VTPPAASLILCTQCITGYRRPLSTYKTSTFKPGRVISLSMRRPQGRTAGSGRAGQAPSLMRVMS